MMIKKMRGLSSYTGLGNLNTMASTQLATVTGGKIVKYMTVGPFTLYKNTKTGKITRRQTTSTASWTAKTMAFGWAKSFHG
ncbi:bacteriocin lactococcin-B [Lactobacillus sp. CBA3605]|uniref:lactococcin family bacteriocin n=1 Tax=Lactobacillus sp. CBA3605 TaxID=2099788 RepID=UPI000CFAA538|nr:lactococcin family bacteriocin [Lactobacillus sp. CBA3605]AVK61836.1 bacteriocin lactococcin-B [Lactobacillus sp. CBA3605]